VEIALYTNRGASLQSFRDSKTQNSNFYQSKSMISLTHPSIHKILSENRKVRPFRVSSFSSGLKFREKELLSLKTQLRYLGIKSFVSDKSGKRPSSFSYGKL